MADEATQNESKRSFTAGLKDTYQRISPQRRMIIGGVAVAVVVGLVALSAGKSDNEGWRPVARDMLPEDIEAAKKSLDDKKIAYKLSEGGTLLVPPEAIHEARLSLAVSSMPSGRSVGFELFDESGMGRSAFAEKVNLHRALEGELARTIRHIEGIERVRVHLVTPERRVFREMDTQPSASVVLSMKNGHSLSRDQARSIQRLVSGAVERLQPGQIAILDQYGALLAGPEDGPMTGAAYERQREQESELERRVLRIIEPIVGAEKVMAKVAVELDFSQVVETREDFDPEQQVIRSEREQVERSDQAGAQPVGAPGTATNLPGRNPGGAQAQTAGAGGREKSDTIRNYEMDKVVRRTENPLPRLKRLSVAVVVDAPSDGKGGTRPRTPDEIAQIERLAARAVGLDTARGDTIEVTSAPFAVTTDPTVDPLTDPTAAPVVPPLWYENPVLWVVGGVGLLALVGLAIFLVARSRAAKKKAAVVALEKARLTPAFTELGEAMAPEQVFDRRQRIAELRERAIELGAEDLHRLGVVFHRWFEADVEEHHEPAPVKKEAA
jgi:flagellar M-ring protein FliF